MKRHFLLIAPCGVVAALPHIIALSAARAEDDVRYRDAIVAEVNGDPLTRHEVEVFSRLQLRYRDILRRGSTAAVEGERRVFLAEQLKNLIEERVLIQEASRQKLALSKEDERRLDREVERQALQHNGVEGLKRQLDDIGVPYDYYVERKRANLLIGKLLLRNVSREIFVPPEQIRRYFQDHPEKFERRGRIVLRHIMLYNDASPEVAARVPPAVKEVAKQGWDAERATALARKLRERILGGAEFAVVAREWSMSPDGDRDGFQMFQENQNARDPYPSIDLIDPVGSVASSMKPGELSEPIASRLGVHLVQLLERRPRGTLPFSEVQRDIEMRLKGDVWQERLKAWIQRVKDDAVIREYFPAG